MTITRPEVFLVPSDIDRIETRLDRIETRITEINDRIDQRIEATAQHYMPAAVVEARFTTQGVRMGGIEESVTELKADKKWLNRMLLGATTAAVLSSFGSMIVALAVA